MQQAPELGLELPSRRARPPSPGRGGRSPAARARARRARRRAVHAAARRMQPGAGRLAARGGARLPPCRPRARPARPPAARAAALLAASRSSAAAARRSAPPSSCSAAPIIASADPLGARAARRPSEARRRACRRAAHLAPMQRMQPGPSACSPACAQLGRPAPARRARQLCVRRGDLPRLAGGGAPALGRHRVGLPVCRGAAHTGLCTLSGRAWGRRRVARSRGTARMLLVCLRPGPFICVKVCMWSRKQ